MMVSIVGLSAKKKSSHTAAAAKRQSSKLLDEDASRIWDDLPKKFRIKKRGAFLRKHYDLKIASNLHIFNLIMWKNYIVVKRRWKLSITQFAAPIFLITVLSIYHTQQVVPGSPANYYPGFSVDTLPNGTFEDCDTFYFSPKIEFIDNLIDQLKNRETAKKFKYEYLSNYTIEPTPVNLCAVIEFEPEQFVNISGELPPILNYHIRFPAVYDADERNSTFAIGRNWDTGFFFPSVMVDGVREINETQGGHPGYYRNGFLYVQHLMATEIIKLMLIQKGTASGLSEKEIIDEIQEFNDKIVFNLRRYPFPGHIAGHVTVLIYEVLPACLVTGYGISCLIMIYISVREKEMGVRSLLTMYGVNSTCHRFTDLLFNWLSFLLSGLFITWILSTKWTTSLTGLYIFMHKYLSEMFFLLVACYTFDIIMTIILISCFFERASTASISVALIWSLGYIPYFYMKEFLTNIGPLETLMSYLSPHISLAIGCFAIAEMQAKNDQYGYGRIFDNHTSIGFIYISLISKGTLKFMLALYCSKVFPEKGMTKHPWNYIFKSWWWNNKLQPVDEDAPPELINEKSYQDFRPEYFEKDEHTKKRKALCVENVTKFTGKTRALHKVKVTCFQDYLTVLLGDQGCGKSILLKILSGTCPPTSGIIYLNRKDLYKNPKMARAFIGYCPSENLLFPDLTVSETLHFFTDLKGLTNQIEAYEEVERFLKITSLHDCRDTMICNLTKSTQRMLMVTTAFCGGSRVVLLDDPTHYLTATEKRLLWLFVDQEKKHRTVVSAMDFIYEVDAVVDKFVLLNTGQVTAQGSLNYLQKALGGGYRLEMDTMSFYDESEIDDLVTRRIEGACLESRSGKRVVYYLPSSKSDYFPGLLVELEKYKLSYGIGKLRMNYVSLDELYIGIRKKQTDFHVKQSKPGKDGAPDVNLMTLIASKEVINPTNDYFPDWTATPHTSKFKLFLHEFKILFLKNVKFSFRNKLVSVMSILLPMTLFLIINFISMRLELSAESKLRRFDELEYYATPYITVDVAEATNEGVLLRKSILNYLAEQHFPIKNLSYTQDIATELIDEIRYADNEYEMSNVALHLYRWRANTSGVDHIPFQNLVKVGFTAYFNNQPLHTPGAALALADNILLYHIENYVQRKLQFTNYTRTLVYMNVSNHPLLLQPEDVVKYSEVLNGPGYLFGVFTTFVYAFLFPFYMIIHIKEQDFRHLQYISGVNKIILWGANYLWNMIHFTCVTALELALLGLLGIPGFQTAKWNHSELLGVMFIFMEIYGATGICLIGSIASRNFKSWGTEFSKLALLFILTGPCVMMILIPIRGSGHFVLFTFLHNLFLLLPGYSFGIGLFYLIANAVHKTECENYHKYKEETCKTDVFIHPFNEFFEHSSTFHSCCFNRKDSYFDFVAYGVGRNIFMLVLVITACIAQKIIWYSKRMR